MPPRGRSKPKRPAMLSMMWWSYEHPMAARCCAWVPSPMNNSARRVRTSPHSSLDCVVGSRALGSARQTW
eukprot:4755060-Pyramimonas_sp.AAC.1